MNQVILCGTALGSPVLSHHNYGKRFYRFSLSVVRLSGTCDIIPVLAPETLCGGINEGDTLYIEGEIRSYNDREAVHNRLKINVWAHTITLWDGEAENSVTLRGILCKQAVYRRTPFGREIADMMLCVPRQYHTDINGRYDYLPCIVWGSVARKCACLPEGTEIVLNGRLQSRAYVKLIDNVPTERTAYEISASSLTLADEEEETENDSESGDKAF